MKQWITEHALLVKIIAIILAIGLTATASVVITTNVLQGEQGPAGEQGSPGEKGDGISSIIKTKTEGLVDTYTVTYTNGETTTFTVTNGADGEQGIQGIQGEKGEDGHTPVITIQNGNWYIDGVDSGKSADGIKGNTGNGISSIDKTKTDGLVDTYTITFTNGATTTFTVTNGATGAQGQPGIQGIQGAKGEDGHSPVITIQNGNWYIDGVDSGKSAEGIKGDVGNGISSIDKTKTEGLVDTYTITFTNGTTSTFTVTNGQQGIQGIQGAKGEDGHSPVITIQGGYWYIDGVNTNESASEGIKGDTGNGISSIDKTKSEGLVDTYTITFTNGTTTTFTVTNGATGAQGQPGIQGIQGAKGEDGHTPVITIQNGKWYIDGVDSGKSAEGIKGDTGNGISSIDKTKTDGLVDTYTITFTNGTTTTFTVTNGEDGQQGIQGEKGEDGHTPVITIQNGNWYIDGVDTGKLAVGIKGDTGNGIAKIEKTKTEGLVDTYTITYTDGTTTTFTVTNGATGAQGQPGIQGIQGAKGEDGHTPVITIQNGNWYIDGADTGKSAGGIKGDTGNGISSIDKTNTVGLVDIYTITYTNGNTSTFTVTNGADGAQGQPGIQGIQGAKGEDGHTPVITIQNGKWYIDGIDSGKSAEGIKGDTGNGISSIDKTKTEGLVDTYTITFTNGTTTTFTVTNGAQGQPGIQGIQGAKGEDGHTPVITIQNGKWYIDGVDSGRSAEGIKGDTGNGISSIDKTKTEGLVDTYTITYTDGTTSTFTVTNGANGQQGIQGEKGEDGHTPVITIQNGNWYIDGVDTGKSAEGVKGDDGLSAFEIYKKYHPEYTGTEAEWIESLKGSDGAQGEQGVSVINAYINSEMHLILVLSNNTEIDAGYIGVSAAKSYSVTFKDYDGSVLKMESVYENEAATAPAVEPRMGYRFTGWSCSFDNITSNLDVIAQYTVEHNQLYLSYVDNGDNTVTATLTLCGDVKLYGLEFNLGMETVGLAYKNTTAKISGAAANYTGTDIKFSYVCDTGSNRTQETVLMEITFDITGSSYSLDISISNVDAFDDVYATETYSLANATYHN